MRKIYILPVITALISLLLYGPLFPANAVPKGNAIQATAIDIDKDGKPDVVYYYDDKYITMAEADTNKDGRADVRVYTRNGKFKSAEADTDYDGKADKEFSNPDDFDAWLNQNNPGYEDYLNRPNWEKTLFSF